ncbi:hypothetical protein G6F62_015286 [Rhizopus arrhizus]|nr:hypothetical protein G6F62_015286 [Rhizopus arrhizus]
MAGLCLAMGGDGVALQPLSGLPRPQCGQCLAVALGSLLLEPIGPLSALGALSARSTALACEYSNRLVTPPLASLIAARLAAAFCLASFTARSLRRFAWASASALVAVRFFCSSLYLA